MKRRQILTVLFISFAMLASSQAVPPPIPPPPPPGLPIDGGLFLLLASGIFYGVKRLVKK